MNLRNLTINIYRWTRKIFWTGYKKDLEETDLYTTLTQDRATHLGEIIGKAWEREVESCTKKKNGCKPQLFRVLLRCFGKPFFLIGIPQAIMELFSKYVKQIKINELYISTTHLASNFDFILYYLEIKDTQRRIKYLK